MEWAASRIPEQTSSSPPATTAPPSQPTTTARSHTRVLDAKPELAAELLSIAKALEQVEVQRQQILGRGKSHSPLIATAASPSRAAAHSPKRTSAVAERAAIRQQHADPRFLFDVLLCECGEELHPSDRKLHIDTECPLREVQCQRPGCGLRFPASERVHHEQTACRAARHSRELLQAKKDGDALVECELCHDQSVPIRRRDLAQHQRMQCVKRVVACRFAEWGCSEQFPSDTRTHHEAHSCVVGKRRAQIAADAQRVNEQTTCDWCTQRVPKRRLLDHQEDDCPARERPCPNASSGCCEWVPVGDVDTHIRTSCCVTLERDALAARAREKNTFLPCRECGAVVTLRRLGRHWRDECVSRIVPCKNAVHGCRARLRWRDRHVHEDFAALSRDRSMLQFATHGVSYVALPSVMDSATGIRITDLPPPWTAEFFVWLVDARDEILGLHRTCVAQLVTQVESAREHERWQKQADACKRKLKALKQQRKPQVPAEGTTTKADRKPLKLTGAELAEAARDLADDFNAAESGLLATQKTGTLAKGWLHVLLAEALRILRAAQMQQELDDDSMHELSAAIAAQASELVQASPVLGELVPEHELRALSDLELWAASVAVTSASTKDSSSADQQQLLATQTKLLKKRAEWQEQLTALSAPNSNATTETSPAEVERLQRRCERELAKIDAKLAAVSANTPLEVLERRGRHVIASSTKNAIALVGNATSSAIAFYRSALPSTSNVAREVVLGCTLQRGRWHHVALTASTRELRLVVDSELKSTKHGAFDLPLSYIGAPLPPPQSTATLSTDVAGCDVTAATATAPAAAAGACSFQGYVQEVRYWRECRSLPQLARFAHAVLPVATCSARLVGYWTFEEGMGESVDDMALTLPRAPCFDTNWVAYDSPAVRRRFGLPPTPSLRERTSCHVNQALKALGQRAHDRKVDAVSCRQHCGDIVTIAQLERHQRLLCRNRLVACNEVGCEQLYRFADELQHRREQCAPRLYRNMLVEQRDAKEAPVACVLNCGEIIKSRWSEQHCRNECVNRLVTCPRRDCVETIVAHAVATHLATECRSAELARERRMVAHARKRLEERRAQLIAMKNSSSNAVHPLPAGENAKP